MENNYANDADEWVDDAILAYIDPAKPTSFFLFAGAGSGKTRTLVNVLSRFKTIHGEQFRLRRKKIAIVTYTNAAADEIRHRLEYSSIFQVSTIHSFAWELIRPFNHDIRAWVRINLQEEIAALIAEQSKSKNLNNKTSQDRAQKIESKSKRLAGLDGIVKFSYKPNGDSTTRDALGHTEVIGIAADFIGRKPLMQRLVACGFPILLIDESQDTKKELVESLFVLQKAMPKAICLGLFGDVMQRIYADGKERLHEAFPKDWATPGKKLNHRSDKRIVTLINSIREDVDQQRQEPRLEKMDGYVRLFICERGVDKAAIEEGVVKRMAEITSDLLWNSEEDNIKILILEHHMAATRLGFFEFYDALHGDPKLRPGLLNGALPGLTIFSNTILPLISAFTQGDQFEVARILRNDSPILSRYELIKSEDQLGNLKRCKSAATELFALWDHSGEPSLIEVLNCVYKSGLFNVPESLLPIVMRFDKDRRHAPSADADGADDFRDDQINAWEVALNQPFSQIARYCEYLSEHSRFGTHQGVKGLEYPRVMVIIDDEEAKGFMFSYDKLFGAKDPTDTDNKNIKEGKETGFDRTKRLFYVACSRACESLAIVAYTDNPDQIKQNALEYSWFADAEIEIL
jgi:DNA helicase II / ATP-dependent DNA helicase PcrA